MNIRVPYLYEKLHEQVFRNKPLLDNGRFNNRATTLHLNKTELGRIKIEMETFGLVKYKNNRKNLEDTKKIFG